MKKMYFKKFMSVFMACIMLLSCWVWIAPEHAHATAGRYYVEIVWYADRTGANDNVSLDGNSNGSCMGFAFEHKTNNGKGTLDTYLYDCKGKTAGKDNTDGFWLDGFPTKVHIILDWGTIFQEPSLYLKSIKIGPDTSNLKAIFNGEMKTWSQTDYQQASLEVGNVYTEDIKGGNHSYTPGTAKWEYPYADTITWSNTPEAMTCPKTGEVSQSVGVTAYDQYGVEMFNPDWSVSGSSCGTTGLSLSLSVGSGTNIKLTNAANIAGATNTQTGTITASWTGASGTAKTSSKTFTINDTTYTATFKNHRNADGVAQADYTTTAQHGVSPTAPTASNYSAGDYDYTFTGWSPTVSGMTADTTYTATYSNGTFVPANYTAVDNAIAAANAIKAEWGNDYENRFTYTSRTALDAAINAVVRGLGRTQQGVVDGFAQAINEKIAALEPNTYAVIFLDKDGTILLYEKDVEYKESVTAPELPDDQKTYHDSENHYTYTGWDSDEYTSVVDDLVISPVYTAQAHDWEIETVTSTCVQAGTTKYTCKVCGFVKYDGGDQLGDHVWEDDFTIDLEPTCTVAGSKSIHCSLCDAQKDITPVEPLGHNFTSQSIAVDATCGKVGIMTKVCDDCYFCEHTIIPALEHDYVETVVAPTCTTKGYTEYVCQRGGCGFTYRDNFTDVAPHSFGAWGTVYEAACGVAGLKKRTCEDCGFIELETVTALEHVIPTEWTVVVNPTCKGEGYQTKTCTLCGVIMAEEEIPALNHNYTITKETAATCTTAGEKVETCSRCGDKNTTVIQPLDHDYDDGVESSADCTHGGFKVYSCKRTGCDHKKYEVLNEATANGHDFTNGAEEIVTPATCTADGEKRIKCNNCEFQITEVIPKTGHNHVAGTAVESTCTESGFIPYTCSCGDTYNVYNEKDPAKGHDFSEFVSEKDATCTEDGEEVYKCSRCDVKQTTVLPKLGHSYVKGTVTVADCTTAGTEVYTCSCGDTYTKFIEAAKGHSFGEWTVIQEPTDKEFGIKKRICACGAEELGTVEPIGDHVFSGVITAQPTCETEGTKVYTCTKHENCSANYEETLPATGHKAKLVYVAPTCTKEGSTQIICETCKEELTDVQTIPVTAHAYGEGVQTTAPTCTEDGVMSYTCACGASRTEVIAKTGHNLSSVYNPAKCLEAGSVVTSCSNANCGYTDEVEIPATGHKLTVTVNNATCTEDGSVVETCTVCGDTKTTTLEALGHNFTADEEVIEDATCTENGEKTVKCSRCDETTTVVIPKLGHDWDEEWTVTEDATCTEDGEETKTCANCNETITAVIPKTGHNWSDWVKVDATNDTDGSWTRTCSNCNEEETVVIPKGGHVWDNGTVTKPATCEETGTMVYKCTAHENCGITLEITLGVIQHTVTTEKKEASCKEGGYVKVYCSECETEFKTETTEKIAHTYTAGTPVPATCITSGYTPYTCSCGDTYKAYNENDPATGHNLVEGSSNATCTAGGVMTLNCSDCTYSTTVEVPARGHNYVKDETASTDATCAAAATETYKCSRCTASYTISVGEKTTEHTWGGWEVKQSATTDAIGLRTRNCTVCGQLDYEIIPATGSHKFDVKIEDQSKDATCVEAGWEVYGCSAHENCTETSKIDLPATGHKPELQYTPATCTDVGRTEMVCTVEGCGEVLDTESISALGHAWGEGKVTPAVCSVDGKIEYECTRCTATYETILAKNYLYHDYETTIMPATCTQAGSIVVKCTRCPSNPVDEVITKLEHAWNDGVIEEGDEATCTEDGTKTYTCTAKDCGATKTEIIPKTGHTWGDWEVTTPSTNGTEGEMTRICENGCKETVKIPAGGHNLVGSVTTPASCTQEGLLIYDCAAHTGDNDCGISIKVTLDKLQHEITTSIETKATCTTDGEVVTKCKNCNTATTITVIPATGHTYDDGVTTNATCTEEGKIVYTCKAEGCGDEREVVLTKLQHNYVAGNPVPATCTDSGYTPYKCATCTSEYVIITESANGHTYKEGESTATCTTAGKMTLACDCGAKMEADVPALGHDYRLEGTTNATCAAAATETYDCSRCEAAYTVSVGSKTENHDWNEWVTVEEATYTSIGYQTRTCKVCDKLEVKTLEKAGDHNLVEVDREEPTCEEDGWIDYECSVHADCGVTDRVELPATGHTEELYYTAATCTQAGSAKIVCTVCDNTLGEETAIPALEHAWGNAQITLSTCQTGGKVEFTCTSCNTATRKVDLPVNPDAHKLTTDVTPATCTAAGSVVTSCELCGDVLETTPIPMIPHTWGDWEVTKAATNSQPGVMTRRCNNGCEETAEIPAGGHAFGENPSSIEAATCTKEGTATYNCTAHADCGVTITVKLDKIQHTPITDTKKASCTEEGYVHAYCEVCKEEFANVTLTKLQHEFVSVETTDPTCTTSGYTTYKCNTCDETYNAIGENAKGHTYVEVEGSSTATCTVGGIKTLKCACGDEITVNVPALGHTYTKGETVAPTCLTSGYTVYKCSCGAAYNEYDATKPATDHNWSDWETTASTNTTAGEMTRHCQNTGCTKTETVEIPAGGHAFSEEKAEVTTPATCTEAGTKVYKCTVHTDCGVTATVTLPTIAHTLTTKVTDADCENAGKVVTSCANCETVNIETPIPALGHAWGNEVVTPATCSATGSIAYECTRTDCNATHRVEIPVNGEAHKLTVTVTDATCEEDGTVVTKCELCGETKIETIAKKGHTWKDDATSTVPATCETEGSATYDCVNCDKQNTVVIPALGHVYKAGDKVAPTCTTSGYTVYVCEHDETHTYNVYDATKPATGHDWSDWTVTTPATETTNGLKTRVCACGEKEEEVIPAMMHSMVEDTAAYLAPTCTAEGKRVYKCETDHNGVNCTYTLTVTLPMIAHSLTTDVTNPKCDTKGLVVTSCENCDTVNITTEIPATGHAWDEGVVTTEATCTKQGVMTFTCQHDATHQYTKIIPMAQHEFEEVSTTAPTCTTSGYTTYKCETCNETYNAIGENAKGHDFTVKVSSTATCTEGGTMTLKCSECDVTMTADVPALGHTYTKVEEVAPTCLTSGYTVYKCSCGAAYNEYDATKPATDHNWSDWETTASTNTTAGEMTRHCQNTGCTKTETVEIPAGGHAFSEENATVTTPATCTKTGTKVYKCTVHTDCGVTATVTLPTIAHTLTTDVTYATCDKAGSVVTRCTECDTETHETTIPALGHAWGNEVVTPATCKDKGSIEYTCTRTDCNETHTVEIPVNGEAHKLTVTVTDATCEEDGTVVTKCELCGETKIETIAKKGHTWKDDATSTVPATCEAEGSATYDCVNCGEQNTVVIPKLGHIYKEGDKVAPTCTTSGYTVYVCEHDETHTYNVYDATKPATGHDWVETSRKNATCTEDGKIYYGCENCSEEKTETIAKLGHNWGEWTITTYPTASKEGVKTRECSEGCKETVTLPMLGHDMVVDEDASTAPTCTEDGEDVYVCTTHTGDAACGYTYKVVVSATGHSYDEGVETTAPTCTKDGVKTYTCHCGAERTEVLPKTGHTLTTDVTDATCVDTGKVVTSCENCDEVNIETELPALGHSFTGTETVTIPATCDVDGEKTVGCSRCDETTKVVIPKLGHDYSLVGTTQATCDAPATETYDCSRCDSSYVKITAPANGHKYSQVEGSSTATCTEAGEITLKCSACGNEIKTAVPALGHAYKLTGTTDATCEAPATETYECSRCDAAYEKSDGETADHSWSDWEITVEATEGSLGYRERECTVCGKTEVEVIPTIGDHSFTIEIERVGVTCDTDGYVTYDCAAHTGADDCGLTSTVKAPATGHKTETIITDATCTEDGLSVTKCINEGCGKVIREEIIPATGHDWDEGTVITEATCSTTGVMKYTCKNDSSHTYTQIIPSEGHAWDEGVETTLPTCTTAGVRTYTCLTDETHTYIQLIPFKGHSYGEWIIDVDATCTEDGSKHRVCADDEEHIETAVIPATGHDMGEWAVETEATCEADGKNVSSCANCDYCLEKTIPAKGHLWSEWKITEGDCLSGYTLGRTCVTCSETQSKAVESSEHTYPTDENGNIIYDSVLSPTCTNEGMYYYDCEVCGGGDIMITAKTPGFEEELAAKGHKWIISDETDEEGWIITREATCFKDGMKYRVCENGCGTNCGLDFESKETVIIPAEHLNWVKQGGKAATCTEEGYTEYYLCMDCGFITGRNKIAATGHTDADNNSKCDTCDIAISSGSSGEIVDCNCMCHETGGFKAFFFKIINFFWKLFRINPVCECGKAHY